MIRPRLRNWFVLLTLVLTAVTARAQSEFAGYRIPEHSWSAWSGNLSASGRHSRFDQPVDATFSDGLLDVRAASSLTWGRDADRSQYALSIAPTLQGNRRSNEQSMGSPMSDERTNRSRLVVENLDLLASTAVYPGGLPIGFTGSALFGGQWVQNWNSESSLNRNPPNEARLVSDGHSRSYTYFSSVSMGPVVGRVRNATPVLDARILEDRLTRTGALTRPLGEQARSQLAQLLATRGRFGNAHMRPDRYFWREVERVLRSDGALAEQGLDAYSQLRVLERVSPALVQRYVGRSFQLFVTPLAIRQHRDASSQSTFSQFDHDTLVATAHFQTGFADHSRSDALSVGWLAEYHRPFGWRWQLDATHQLGWNDAASALFVVDGIATTWMVADRWLASSNWRHSAFSSDRSGSRKIESWALGHSAELQYQLEDAWALALRWDHSQQHDPQVFRRSDTFSLGVSYQFSGHFVAPGLVEPMQLAPPER